VGGGVHPARLSNKSEGMGEVEIEKGWDAKKVVKPFRKTSLSPNLKKKVCSMLPPPW